MRKCEAFFTVFEGALVVINKSKQIQEIIRDDVGRYSVKLKPRYAIKVDPIGLIAYVNIQVTPAMPAETDVTYTCRAFMNDPNDSTTINVLLDAVATGEELIEPVDGGVWFQLTWSKRSECQPLVT